MHHSCHFGMHVTINAASLRLWQRAGAGSRAQLRTLSGNARSNQERVYRLGSVGMDCQLFLWDVIILQDSALSSLRYSQFCHHD